MNEKLNKNSEELLEKLADLSESAIADLVIYHNRKYFEDNSPEITDEAFDKLVEALRFLNPRAKALSKIGHKDYTHAAARFGKDVVHQDPMLSLEKCYDDNSFTKWAQKISSSFVVMPKIDGVACSIKYSPHGELIEVATRGDGQIGEDITKNALLIADLKVRLDFSMERDFEVRGEIFLPVSQFRSRFADAFASPRNLAAGFLKLKEADRTKNNYLKFFPYDIRGTSVTTEEEKFRLLERLGFSMMPWQVVANDEHAMKPYYEFLDKRTSFDYEIDGVVYRANSVTEQIRLGETAHHPRYAMAYKFHGETAQTKLIGVRWSVARSGVITPIALVEPVFVSGAIIERASLHNLRIFLEHDLREESLVEINRRGGVIPYLERVLSKKGEKIPIPETCPSCGHNTVVEGDFLRCGNPKGCEDVAVSKLFHYCHVLDIDGMGEKIIRRLVQNGLLNNLADIYRLSVEKLMTLDRMGDVLARKLMSSINAKRMIGLKNFIQSLGINEIGSNVSLLLVNNFHTLERIQQLTKDELLPIQGIGESIATSLLEGFAERRDEIEDLLTEITVLNDEGTSNVLDTSSPFYLKNVLFTGKMAHLDRKAAQNTVKKCGGKAPGAMSKHVDYLVIGDEGSPLLGEGKKSTKQKEAEKIISEGGQVKIISETEFLRMLDRKNE